MGDLLLEGVLLVEGVDFDLDAGLEDPEPEESRLGSVAEDLARVEEGGGGLVEDADGVGQLEGDCVCEDQLLEVPRVRLEGPAHSLFAVPGSELGQFDVLEDDVSLVLDELAVDQLLVHEVLDELLPLLGG